MHRHFPLSSRFVISTILGPSHRLEVCTYARFRACGPSEWNAYEQSTDWSDGRKVKGTIIIIRNVLCNDDGEKNASQLRFFGW